MKQWVRLNGVYKCITLSDPDEEKGKYDNLIFEDLNPGRSYREYLKSGRTEQEVKRIFEKRVGGR